ncbi:MAG: cobalamin-dependent protein [Negativicutes bacterium]|nr:cobalamin-dependent protein [Negativicutes bacterium]
MKKVLLAPLDPVHDIGLKMMARGLEAAGHTTILLPPDLLLEEIISRAVEDKVDTILVSRTLGYGVAELLARFIDMADAAGLRQTARIGIGGMAIRPELAAELGFDAGFGPGTSVAEVICFVEEREYAPNREASLKQKFDICQGYDYRYRHAGIERQVKRVTGMIREWVTGRTSPGIMRAELRHAGWDAAKWREGSVDEYFTRQYAALCGEIPRNFYGQGELHPKTRRVTPGEVRDLEAYLATVRPQTPVRSVRHTGKRPLVFNQYGTGCPFMDIGHILASEAWGVDGVVHFDPSWGARTEGFLDGFLTHQEDGTVLTPANLDRIRAGIHAATLWQVRAHRGLNTPETVVLAGKLGADLTKINFCYGMLGAGTDPERMVVDGCAAVGYAAAYNLPFDIVTNEELCGVPAHKAFAGMLIVADLALELGAKPILQPLFAYSPEVMINGWMADNYIDFNVAKVQALRQILNAPLWPGAPIGFLTHTEDRVQSAITTALHASLAASLQVDAISIASADEAYSGGPITAAARIDTLQAVQEGFRFFGTAGIEPTAQAGVWAQQLVEGIEQVLTAVAERGDFIQAVYDGLLGSTQEGAYPGRIGRGTVIGC